MSSHVTTRIIQEVSFSRSPIDANVIRHVLMLAGDAVRCARGSSVSVILIGDAKMRALNSKYRRKYKTTNVLAFPMEVKTRKQGNGKTRKQGNKETIDLGDIFISLTEARREAKKYGWTMRYEIARLALHGFLNLLGYDHVRENDAKVMEKIERNILGNF